MATMYQRLDSLKNRLNALGQGAQDKSKPKQFKFHPGQIKAWNSESRFILILAGTRGGKTSFGPWWLYREMQRCGPGDYLLAAPSYPLLDKGAFPEIKKVFTQHYGVGKFRTRDYIIDKPEAMGWPKDSTGRIIFGHAQNPDSLEAATIKSAWLDECGQKAFKLDSWQAIQRRVSFNQGRVLMTTTPYVDSWLRPEFVDRYDKKEEGYDVISFETIANPDFPLDEWERAMRTLPPWKFDMFYRGLFTRPAGQIYDCWDESIHVVEPFPIPANWPRYLGIDFGGVNTAAIILAKDPASNIVYAIGEYHEGGRSAKEHASALKNLVGVGVEASCGGSKSEGQWRMEFNQGGLHIHEPDQSDVEVGINRVYAALKLVEFKAFKSCQKLIREFSTYSRETDEQGTPSEKIADKDTFHHLDALRYGLGWLRKPKAYFKIF